MGEPQPPGPDLRPWQAKLNAARDSESSDLKSAADKWAASLAALIGAVGTISVLVVPKALTDFSDDTLRAATFSLVLAAGAAGLLALGAATFVSQGWPKIDATMDAARFRQQTLDKLASGVTWLLVSRWSTILAVVCVIAASVISQVDTITAPSAGVEVLVVHKDGSATCTPIAKATASASVSSVTVVAHC